MCTTVQGIELRRVYLLLPVGSFSPKPGSSADLVFYSASTIAASGGGGITPVGIGARLLTDYEVFCGLILIVVCFTVYVGRALAEKHKRVRGVRTATPSIAPAPQNTVDDATSEHDLGH